MKYKKLHNFKDIINRTDFDYISNINNIKRIEEIIEIGILNPSINDEICIQLLRDFNSNIETIHDSINGQNIELLRKGYFETRREIENALKIFVKVFPESRKTIGRHTIHTIKKRFLRGLSFYYKGLIDAFKPDYIKYTNLKNDQIIRYILDTNIGLGKFFKYNKVGKHSAYNKIVKILNRDELITTIKLLQGKSQTRIPNKWIDLGERGTIIRILMQRKNVYFIFKISEHRDYERQLNIPPEKVTFEAA